MKQILKAGIHILKAKKTGFPIRVGNDKKEKDEIAALHYIPLAIVDVK